jgi:ubiquinone/menaquinone biosynthesis C-methylase UbiE
MQQNEDVLAKFTALAPYWETHSETIRGMFAPITEALVQEAQIEPGNSVLDVATGTGEPALSVARIVGPAGSVVGVDPVAETIAVATRASDGLHLTNIRFHKASAELLPFPDASFDAVLSRFGIMFFPSPLQAVREMLRVTKAGRTLAFAVWGFADRNPFHCVLSQVVDRYVAPETLQPDSPEAFRFASPGKLLRVLNEAGATHSSERSFQFTITVALSVEDYWALRLQMSDTLRTKLTRLEPHKQSGIRHEVIQALQPYATAKGLGLPAEVLIVSGAKA